MDGSGIGRNVVYKSGVEKEMSLQEIVDILASPDLAKISTLPAVKPKGGSVFVYRCPDYDSRHDIRADQYLWCQQGTKKIPKEDPVLKRFYMYIRTEAPIRNIYSKRPKKTFAKYDVRFMKVEYELIDAEDPLVLVHYIGDETVWKPFRHGNSVRNDRPFVRTMKSAVKRRVLELGAIAPPREVYKTLLTAPATTEPGYEAVTAPRNKEQIRNYLKFANLNRNRSDTNASPPFSQAAKRRHVIQQPVDHAEMADDMDSMSATESSDMAYETAMSQTYPDLYETGAVPVDDDEVILNGLDPRAKFYPLFPTFEICCNGRLQGFVDSMTLLPQVAITLANKHVLNVVSELITMDAANKIDRFEFYYVSAGPVAGGYYLSTLLFRHPLFETEPVVPAAYLIHERRNINDHRRLFEMLKTRCLEVATCDSIFITDREFSSISSILPSAIQLYNWHYFEDDVVNWVESNGGTQEDSNRFMADVYALMKAKNPDRFSRDLAVRRRRWPPSFQSFFDNCLKPAIMSKGARWHSVGLGGVYDPHHGVCIPPCNNLNQLVGELVEWHEATLEQLIQCLYHFSDYYAREIERSVYQVGLWKLFPKYAQYAKSISSGRLRSMVPFELGHTNNIVNHVRLLAASDQGQEEVVITETI